MVPNAYNNFSNVEVGSFYDIVKYMIDLDSFILRYPDIRTLNG